MKKLFSLLIILTISSVSVFSQTETYLSLVKKSVDSLSVQLQIKERIKSYSIMDIIVKDFNSGAITIPYQFFSKYYNESFPRPDPELKQAYTDYLDNNQKYTYYLRGNKEYEKIMNLPTGNADEIKTRNDRLAGLRAQQYKNDIVYKDLFDKNNLYIKRYQTQVLSHLYNSYKAKNEIFPVSMLGVDGLISKISNFYPSIYSLNIEIEIIKTMIQSMNMTYVKYEADRKTYSSKVIDSLIIEKKQNIENVRVTPFKIRELEQRLAKLTTIYNKLVFDKFIEMRVADSSTIAIYTYPIATNKEFINSVDSLRNLRDVFESKNSRLSSILKSDKEYSDLYKRAENHEISSDVFRNESSYIIYKRFKYDENYTIAERERDRALFKSNLSILRHLLEVSSKENTILDFSVISGSELNQIKSLPELFVMENEINNIKFVIRSSWNNYYYKTYGIPYVREKYVSF